MNIQRVVEYLPYDNPVGMCIYLRYMCIQNIVSWNILFNPWSIQMWRPLGYAAVVGVWEPMGIYRYGGPLVRLH